MRMDRINADGIAIPHEKIDAWKRRGAELDRLIADAQREKADIARKLEAVAVLAPEIMASDFQLTSPTEHGDDASVIDHVVAAVNESPMPLLPKQVRRLLHGRAGVPPFSDNYFYTALKRAADKGFILKVGDRYARKRNPEAETPGS
jgi:hypothetical protein